VAADPAADQLLADAGRTAQTLLLAGASRDRAVAVDLTALRGLLSRDVAASDPKLAALIARSGGSPGRIQLVTGQERLIATRAASTARTLRRVATIALVAGLAALLVAIMIAPDRPGITRRAGALMLLVSVTPLVTGAGVPVLIRRVADPATRTVTAALADRLLHPGGRRHWRSPPPESCSSRSVR
jgi:hypothetical protein